ncbi:MAG: 16S rRNA (cytidine(1402)-2'-O)-methyltransferase [Desulfitobacteriaceae bacterium]|nr:16S rRNA (cytidine(1402)-2'-O)-methyltransferase [Desulfitobacteriaceae bacterium]MDD4345381.1 16S rRNA (cytidine(1402)-2'-O)-methyltransferase [Desulfitobacteriaceae bacterium]MDD4400296.1 16S rRNA (cytidine(1402)-2'-O)-methyltransferase [Desulfitobacteriaceae bacterium]
MLEKGILYVCATPIGNLADITLRVLDTLRQVDFIAAEDTRHSRKLMLHYGINTPLISYHQHNEKTRSQEFILKLKEGFTVALITDAGMPGISDPGSEIIRSCYTENIKVDVLPGPNAALTALVLSGMSGGNFAFQGFLPANSGESRRKLQECCELPMPQIFYEAPHRLIATLKLLEEVFGDRFAVVVREITKLNQSVYRGPLSELVRQFEINNPRGECCIVTSPYLAVIKTSGPGEWVREVREALEHGLSRQDALKEVAKRNGISKREVYNALLRKQND